MVTAHAAAAAIRPLTDREFRLFQELVHRESGIYLSDAKRALLVGRLSRRLRELGVTTFEGYYELVVNGPDAGERVRMINYICTHETHFFREPRQFELLEQTILPQWRAEADAGARPRRVRVWSAACSSGEEPYSLAMSLLAHLPAAWELEVVATDLSTNVLERARGAVWPLEKATEIPAEYCRRFMLRGKGVHAGKMKAGPEIRALVRFQQLNLNESSYALPAGFDLVFCRNVLIYFDGPSKAAVIDRLIRHLAPTGFLFLGHAESLNGMTTPMRGVMPTVYRFADK